MNIPPFTTALFLLGFHSAKTEASGLAAGAPSQVCARLQMAELSLFDVELAG